MAPIVSIVTCTYNRAHLIGETIRSVLNQSVQDFEYIIIDDGSQDETKKVVEAFNDSRIRYFYHERTGGKLSKLRNFANSKCSGEFIAYVDSDDLWASNKLERQISAMQKNSSIGFSFTDIEIFNKDKTIRNGIYGRSGTYTGSVFQAMLQNELVICHTTLVVRKSCLDRTGPMDERLHSGDHDHVFFLSRLFDAYVIYEPLVRVRKHDQNSTLSSELFLKLLKEHHFTLHKLLKEDLISLKQYKASMAITSYSFGIQAVKEKEYSAAAHYFWKSIKIKPWHLKSWVRLLLTLPYQVIRF